MDDRGKMHYKRINALQTTKHKTDEKQIQQKNKRKMLQSRKLWNKNLPTRKCEYRRQKQSIDYSDWSVRPLYKYKELTNSKDQSVHSKDCTVVTVVNK